MSQACASAASPMVRSSRLVQSLAWLEKISSMLKRSRSSRQLATHKSSRHYKEDSYDQMLFKRSCSEILASAEEQCLVRVSGIRLLAVHSSGLFPEPAASPAEGAASTSSARASESSSVQTQPPPGRPQPQQIRSVTGKQAPSEFEINMIKSLKQGIFEINEMSVNTNQEEVDQELQLLQDLRFQERYEGDLQGYSEKEVEEVIKKELVVVQAMKYMIQFFSNF